MTEATAKAAEDGHHLYPLIGDLGLILMTAGVAVLLFKKIRQPLVLGYLIAGFLAGPYFEFFPSVKDKHNVEVWAEIGVIILLFSLGLEFSFKKLMRVGGSASVTAIVQISCMIGLGYLTGQLMGWSQMDSIFLGAILSISSTTIIIRAFEEVGVKTQKFASIVFGALIIEDIVAILLLVLLTTISVSQQFSGMELLESAFKLVFFLILWFVGGIFFIPTFFKKLSKLLNEETTLIISLAMCLMMVILAEKAGFSPALGAFIMGSIIAETTRAERIEHLVKPVKDLFGAVFFVSVGMLINPETLAEYWLPVLIITLVTIVGKTLSTTLGAVISGQPLRQSVQAGMSLAQIGEFSFIIATLGMNLGVTSKFLYPIVVAISAITTFTTPFFIRSSGSFYTLLQKVLPGKLLRWIENYSYSTQTIQSASNWKIFIKANVTQILLHSVIILGVILLSSKYILPLPEDSLDKILIACVVFVVLSPFLWALGLRRVAATAMDSIKRDRKYRGPVTIVLFIRVCLALFYTGLLLNNFFSPLIALGALALLIAGGLLFPSKLKKAYYYLENHFMDNLNSREIHQRMKSRSELSPWDGHMAVFEVPQESSIAGKSLYDLHLREDLGINIAIIKRGEKTINVPPRNEKIFPKDTLYVIGSDAQVLEFEKYLENTRQAGNNAGTEVVLKKITLAHGEFTGKSIREAQLRERTNGLVVGIERGNERIMNPESEMVLKRNDVLWLVGDKKLLENLF
ncbi:cation:proton antiporter [uncultured Flavobacterium sp.]|uniref:cation:proton antiporter domain-containing protein n=1 Tax=uncultured Flavobacterium sp. TaxID=165435 RepID=UPI0025F67EA8|nr:cation:proton antiporter [uncultured Flavobacterium sp.]